MSHTGNRQGWLPVLRMCGGSPHRLLLACSYTAMAVVVHFSNPSPSLPALQRQARLSATAAPHARASRAAPPAAGRCGGCARLGPPFRRRAPAIMGSAFSCSSVGNMLVVAAANDDLAMAQEVRQAVKPRQQSRRAVLGLGRDLGGARVDGISCVPRPSGPRLSSSALQ
eukprot:349655-Chlamydomonas_euryale.AAC.5